MTTEKDIKCCGQPFEDNERGRFKEEVQKLNILISTLTVANQQMRHKIRRLEETLREYDKD